MPFPFRELVRALRINSGNDPPHFKFVELTRELEDLRKFSFQLLMTFLTVHAISAFNALGATTLALLVYTINLRVTLNASFLQLVIVVQSPAIAAAVLLACALPPLIIAVHLARQYVAMTLTPFSVQMRDMAPAVPGADTTVISG